MQAKRIAKIVAAVFLVGSVQLASAVIAVDWKAMQGFFKSDGVTPLLGGAGTQTALAQLIFSTDLIADPANSGTLHYTTGDDQWLADWTVDAVTFSTYGEFEAATYNSAFVSGYLYVRVFDQGSMSVISNDMWYFSTPLTNTFDNTTDPLIPNVVNYSLMTAAFGDTLDMQVVPEPSTWAFLALGLAALAGRKFRRG